MTFTGTPLALIEGQSTLLATVTAAGVVQRSLTYQSNYGRHELTVQANQKGGTGSTVTVQLQASLDGVNFFNVGTAMNLGGASASVGVTTDVAGLEGAVLALDVTTYTAGTGVTGTDLLVLLG